MTQSQGPSFGCSRAATGYRAEKCGVISDEGSAAHWKAERAAARIRRHNGFSVFYRTARSEIIELFRRAGGGIWRRIPIEWTRLRLAHSPPAGLPVLDSGSRFAGRAELRQTTIHINSAPHEDYRHHAGEVHSHALMQ